MMDFLLFYGIEWTNCNQRATLAGLTVVCAIFAVIKLRWLP